MPNTEELNKPMQAILRFFIGDTAAVQTSKGLPVAWTVAVAIAAAVAFGMPREAAAGSCYDPGLGCEVQPLGYCQGWCDGHCNGTGGGSCTGWPDPLCCCNDC